MSTIAEWIKIDAKAPAPDLIAHAARELAAGKVGILPTSCLYGLGADAMNPAAVDRIFEIKQRDNRKPLLVLISQMAQVDELAISISPLARQLMQCFWPGKVTFLLEARSGLPAGLVGPDGKVGIRLAGHPVAAALVEAAGVPLTGTSANLSNHPGCRRMDQMDDAILNAVDLIIDAGRLAGGVGSSIVDATLPNPAMLRHGALCEEKFKKAVAQLQRKG